MQTCFSSFSVLSFVCALSTPTSAQQIWKVNCLGGAGVDFTDLPPAVAAAAPGDEIRVYRSYGTICPLGSYYTATLITKPLRIVGFDPSGSPYSSTPTRAEFQGAFVIQGIPAGQMVVLSNINLGQGIGSASQGGIVAVDCAGDILLEDVYYSSNWSTGSYVHFERCANVVLRRCSINLGGWPIRFIDSTALLTSTYVDHVPSLAWPFNYEQTSEALRVHTSTVTLIDSVLYGNDRYDPPPAYPITNWIERPAAVIESGTLRVGPATRLYGGFSGFPYPNEQAWAYRFAPPATGTVEQDPRSLIYHMPLPAYVPQPIPTDIHATYHAWVVGGEDFQVTVAGPANGFGLLAIGDWQPLALPTSLGPLAVTPASLTLLDIAPLAAGNGSFEWTLHCPSTAAVAHAFCMQAAVLSPTGILSLTVPSPLTVGWPNGQIP
ncbi:MAG TPA: hypothetical protein VFZ65_08030 [Planctomycetota bacterium]|nr:hypothetical protein [Planctomycetota bacterium]